MEDREAAKSRAVCPRRSVTTTVARLRALTRPDCSFEARVRLLPVLCRQLPAPACPALVGRAASLVVHDQPPNRIVAGDAGAVD